MSYSVVKLCSYVLQTFFSACAWVKSPQCTEVYLLKSFLVTESIAKKLNRKPDLIHSHVHLSAIKEKEAQNKQFGEVTVVLQAGSYMKICLLSFMSLDLYITVINIEEVILGEMGQLILQSGRRPEDS